MDDILARLSEEQLDRVVAALRDLNSATERAEAGALA
jgi:hypothetical protein